MSGRSARAPLGVPPAAEDDDRIRCYLLFAGSQHTRQGGLGDLVGTFQSEVAAREAFRHLRLSQTSASTWAQLAVVDGDHGIRALSWFGIGAAPARTPVTFPRPRISIDTRAQGGVMRIATCESPSPAGPEVEPSARRHPLKGIVAWLVGLVALAAITIGVVSDDGTPRPATPNPASVGGAEPASSPVVPFSVDGLVVGDGTSSVDG